MGTVLKSELKVADVILVIIVLLAIVFSSLGALKHNGRKQVMIYKDNELWGSFDLGIDRMITIDAHNQVEIANGKVRMSYADCPGQRCVKQGFTSSIPIICIPNKITVEITEPGSEKKLILH